MFNIWWAQLAALFMVRLPLIDVALKSEVTKSEVRSNKLSASCLGHP